MSLSVDDFLRGFSAPVDPLSAEAKTNRLGRYNEYRLRARRPECDPMKEDIRKEYKEFFKEKTGQDYDEVYNNAAEPLKTQMRNQLDNLVIRASSTLAFEEDLRSTISKLESVESQIAVAKTAKIGDEIDDEKLKEAQEKLAQSQADLTASQAEIQTLKQRIFVAESEKLQLDKTKQELTDVKSRLATTDQALATQRQLTIQAEATIAGAVRHRQTAEAERDAMKIERDDIRNQADQEIARLTNQLDDLGQKNNQTIHDLTIDNLALKNNIDQLKQDVASAKQNAQALGDVERDRLRNEVARLTTENNNLLLRGNAAVDPALQQRIRQLEQELLARPVQVSSSSMVTDAVRTLLAKKNDLKMTTDDSGYSISELRALQGAISTTISTIEDRNARILEQMLSILSRGAPTPQSARALNALRSALIIANGGRVVQSESNGIGVYAMPVASDAERVVQILRQGGFTASIDYPRLAFDPERGVALRTQTPQELLRMADQAHDEILITCNAYSSSYYSSSSSSSSSFSLPPANVARPEDWLYQRSLDMLSKQSRQEAITEISRLLASFGNGEAQFPPGANKVSVIFSGNDRRKQARTASQILKQLGIRHTEPLSIGLTEKLDVSLV
jgi:hypothetical protein